MDLKKLLVTSCFVSCHLMITPLSCAMEKNKKYELDSHNKKKEKKEKKDKKEKKEGKGIIRLQPQSSIIKEKQGENYDQKFIIMVLGEKKAQKLFSQDIFNLDSLEKTGKILKKLGKEAKLLGKLWNKIKSLPLENKNEFFKKFQEQYMDIKKIEKKEKKKKALNEFYQGALEETEEAIKLSKKSLPSTIKITTKDNQKLEIIPINKNNSHSKTNQRNFQPSNYFQPTINNQDNSDEDEEIKEAKLLSLMESKHHNSRINQSDSPIISSNNSLPNSRNDVLPPFNPECEAPSNNSNHAFSPFYPEYYAPPRHNNLSESIQELSKKEKKEERKQEEQRRLEESRKQEELKKWREISFTPYILKRVKDPEVPLPLHVHKIKEVCNKHLISEGFTHLAFQEKVEKIRYFFKTVCPNLHDNICDKLLEETGFKTHIKIESNNPKPKEIEEVLKENLITNEFQLALEGVPAWAEFSRTQRSAC